MIFTNLSPGRINNLELAAKNMAWNGKLNKRLLEVFIMCTDKRYYHHCTYYYSSTVSQLGTLHEEDSSILEASFFTTTDRGRKSTRRLPTPVTGA